MKTLKYKTIASGLTLFLLAINSLSIAQDTLHFRNGSQTIAKVIEITSVVVKYKKLDNLDGPTYSDLKNDLTSITYKNGMTEKFEYQMPAKPIEIKKTDDYAVAKKRYPELSPFGQTKFSYERGIIGNHEMHSILLNVNDPKISSLIKTAKRQERGQYIGFAFFPCMLASGVILAEAASGAFLSDGAFNDAALGSGLFAIAGVACVATSISLKVKRTHNEKEALKLYRQNYSNSNL